MIHIDLETDGLLKHVHMHDDEREHDEHMIVHMYV